MCKNFYPSLFLVQFILLVFSPEGDLMDCDGKSDSSPERETVDDDAKVTEGADGIKKRKRKPYRPGRGHSVDDCHLVVIFMFSYNRNIPLA